MAGSARQWRVMNTDEETPRHWAHNHRFGGKVPFGEIEHRLGMTTESYSAWFQRQQRVQMAAVICGVAIFGAFATVGPGGWIPGIRSSTSADPMSSGMRDVLLPINLLLGIVGMAMYAVQWWRIGRRRNDLAYVIAVLSLVVCGALTLRYTPDDLGEGVFVLMGVVTACALLLMIAETFFSRPGGVWAYRYQQLAERLTTLPERTREELLEERGRILNELLRRKELHPEDAEILRSLPLGGFWAMEPRFEKAVTR